MQYTKKFHINCADTLLQQYQIPAFCIYSLASELVGRADSNTIIVVSSLNDFGNENQILLSLKHILEQDALLFVIDNPDISTAVIDKNKRDIWDIVPKATSATQKAVANQILKYVNSELEFYNIPSDFPNIYWDYELGKIKLADTYTSLGISKQYFYNICEIYEKTIHYHACQYRSSVDIIQTAKRRECNYDKMLEILKPYEDEGLTFEALSKLEIEMQYCWIDLWRILLSLQKSQFYYYYLKDNPSLKAKPLYVDIKSALDVLKSNPIRFIEMSSVQMARYSSPKDRILSYL